jgi:peroxiredoxin Q/BCP
MKALKEGAIAPSFATATWDGKPVSSEGLRGERVILFFYPRDNTPGCTIEACSFRDRYFELKKLQVKVFGISPDSAKSHQKFSEKFNLPYPLLLDENREIANAYGVFGPKTFMGRLFQGIHRTTFLIGKDGRIENIWAKVKPAEHLGEILSYLKLEK